MHCDVFCRVVDNYGDAGVALRLALALAREHSCECTIWIDKPEILDVLIGAATLNSNQCFPEVLIRAWSELQGNYPIAHLVIECFSCNLPEKYVERMALTKPIPLWVNIEHLSAEPWICDFHLMPSPHPILPLTRYFFFPGFVAESGGLLKAPLSTYPIFQREFSEELRVLLFSYQNPRIKELLSYWARGEPESPTVFCQLADQYACREAEKWLGHTLKNNKCVSRNKLKITKLAMVSQDDFDKVLADSDINFVRGEDSFVRAQWMGRPFVWQPYPQADDVHLQKMLAFLNLYCASMPQELAQKVRNLWLAWNGIGDMSAAITALPSVMHAWSCWSATWPIQLQSAGNLTDKLLHFVHERL